MKPIISLACLLLAQGPLFAAELRPGQLEIWIRQAGHGSAEGAGRDRVWLVDLDATPQKEVERADLQYNDVVHAFRGSALRDLIAKYAPPPSVDVALLHFANGMIVPLPFRDAAVMSRLDPFVARAMRYGNETGLWRKEFPPVIRGDGFFKDARPIAFQGNKLVVADRWHPEVDARARAQFSPWSHVDALVGVELVDGPAYRAQFDVDPAPDARAGLALFRGTCQFCHGARRIGAQFGWDFVEPVPIYTYRKTEKNLYYHIAFRPANAPERGLMMPGLKYMTIDDAHLILAWLRSVATRPLPAYAPGPKSP